MNKEHYLDLLFSNEALQATTTTTLEALCLEFPYCQLSSMLHTKKLLLDNDIHYESNLQKTAIQVGSRTALFRFLKLNTPKSKPSEEVKIRQKEISTQKSLIKEKKIDELASLSGSFSAWLKNKQTQAEQTTEISTTKDVIKKTKKLAVKSPEKRPKPKLGKNYVNQDMSQESVRENDLLVTETLAKVYLDQGLHNKAIKAYEILSLKYPQKSAFFADRIQNIRELTL